MTIREMTIGQWAEMCKPEETDCERCQTKELCQLLERFYPSDIPKTIMDTEIGATQSNPVIVE